MTDVTLMEKLISLCKRRGFIFQGSEIYGGLAGIYDYGPLGVELRNNIKNYFWKTFITDREDMYPMSAAILMPEKVWQASGHTELFTDPMVECKNCNSRQRTDQLISKENINSFILNIISLWREKYDEIEKNNEDVETLFQYYKKQPISQGGNNLIDNHIKNLSQLSESWDQISNIIDEAEKYQGLIIDLILKNTECPICHEIKWSSSQVFNLLVETKLGASEKTATTVYLRGEITQGVHVNFKNVLDSMHPKIPFGIGQIGKAFRNEITPRDFLFRQREFEQMEIQYYIKPEEKEGQEIFEYWKQKALEWYYGLGFKPESLRLRQHALDERAHYAKDAWDIEYNMPDVGWKEAWGIHHRGDWDLRRHSEFSSTDLSYFDEATKERFIPWDIECSGGVDRAVLFTLLEAYTEDDLGGETRPYLKLKPAMAPVLCAVSPLLKNKPELVEKARGVFTLLKKEFGRVAWDDNGNIGKRYRRQDEIGTPWCIVIDFDTLGENPDLLDTVTIRDRDTGSQERIAIDELISKIKSQL